MTTGAIEVGERAEGAETAAEEAAAEELVRVAQERVLAYVEPPVCKLAKADPDADPQEPRAQLITVRFSVGLDEYRAKLLPWALREVWERLRTAPAKVKSWALEEPVALVALEVYFHATEREYGVRWEVDVELENVRARRVNEQDVAERLYFQVGTTRFKGDWAVRQMGRRVWLRLVAPER